MTDASAFTKVEAGLQPRLLTGDPQWVRTSLVSWAELGLAVRAVRGRKMRTLDGLFDEFAAALQFPLYFGENKEAFHECISELENLPAGQGYVVTITEPDQVLVEEDSGALRWLAQSLQWACEAWAQPIELGEWWDRTAVPFHVVLAGDSVQIEIAARRWSGAGAFSLPLGSA